jgi:hypothetical protein
MKSKYVILASALLISVATFAQKTKLKLLKSLKKGDSKAATILADCESLVANS